MMPVEINYAHTVVSFRQRSTESSGYAKSLETLKSRGLVDLSNAASCVAIGAGFAERELEFVDRMLPNLRRLTAVEPNATFAAQLKRQLSEHLPPDVRTVVCQQKIQDWEGVGVDDKPADVVLCLHVLHYLTEPERRRLIQRLDRDVLADGGYVVTLGEVDPSEGLRIFRMLGTNPAAVPSIGPVKREMLDAGFSTVDEQPVEYSVDVAGIENDANFVDFVRNFTPPDVTRQNVIGAIRDVAAGRDELSLCAMLSVYGRAASANN